MPEPFNNLINEPWNELSRQQQMQRVMPFRTKPLIGGQKQGETIDWATAFETAETSVFNSLEGASRLSVLPYLHALLRGEIPEHALSMADIGSLIYAIQLTAANPNLESYDLFCYLRYACDSSEAGPSLLKTIRETIQPSDHLSALHLAVLFRGDINGIMDESIQQGTRTPLHYAVVLKDGQALQDLLEQFPETQDVQDDAARSLVYMTASMGASNLFDILVAHGANLDQPGGPAKLIPLYVAYINGHSDAFDKLINAGAKPDARSLVVAAEQGDLVGVSKLIEAGINVDALYEGRSALYQAVAFRHYDVISYLIYTCDASIDLPINGTTATEKALQDGEMRSVIMLHEARLVNWLDHAARFNQPEAVSWLIRKGVDVNASYKGVSPIFSAAQFGYKEVVIQLLEAGADTKLLCHNMTLLLWTVIANQPKIVSLLSSRGADVNALSKDNITPLDYVTINKDTEMTRLLLSLGAICSPINAYSMIESNDIDSLSVLLKARPELVNTLKIEGFPLLHVASELGKLAIVELLISKGADVNALSDDNETAFICAVRNSHDDICTRLLAERAMLEYPGLIVPSNSRLSPHILGSIFSSSSSSDDDDDERNELSDDLSAAQSSYKG